MDILFIEKLVVMALIGVYDWESRCLQKLIFDLKLGYKFRSIKDNIENKYCYVDYTQVTQIVFNTINGKRFFLIEDVAEHIAKVLLERFQIVWVYVKINKSRTIKYAHSVGVCITRMK